VKRRLVVAGVIAGAAAAVFVVIWFQPQKLAIDKQVNEAAPTPAPQARSSTDGEIVASGTFKALTHTTEGTAKVIRLGKKTYLRFEDFKTENGPDVVVYLSTGEVDGPNRALASDVVDLGSLKGNIGDQNYRVPEGTDLAKYKTAVVWCRRFTVAFAAAALV
jgi:hypothetical protein